MNVQTASPIIVIAVFLFQPTNTKDLQGPKTSVAEDSSHKLPHQNLLPNSKFDKEAKVNPAKIPSTEIKNVSLITKFPRQETTLTNILMKCNISNQASPKSNTSTEQNLKCPTSFLETVFDLFLQEVNISASELPKDGSSFITEVLDKYSKSHNISSDQSTDAWNMTEEMANKTEDYDSKFKMNPERKKKVLMKQRLNRPYRNIIDPFFVPDIPNVHFRNALVNVKGNTAGVTVEGITRIRGTITINEGRLDVNLRVPKLTIRGRCVVSITVWGITYLLKNIFITGITGGQIDVTILLKPEPSSAELSFLDYQLRSFEFFLPRNELPLVMQAFPSMVNAFGTKAITVLKPMYIKIAKYYAFPLISKRVFLLLKVINNFHAKNMTLDFRVLIRLVFNTIFIF